MNIRVSCLSLLILLLSLIILNFGSLYDFLVQSIDKKAKYHIFTAIFSARDHFEQRDTIRRTWKRLFADENNNRIVFVVGDRDCDVPKSHLHDLYSCNLHTFNTSLISTSDKIYAQRIQEFHKKSTKCNEPFVGFAFQVFFSFR